MLICTFWEVFTTRKTVVYFLTSTLIYLLVALITPHMFVMPSSTVTRLVSFLPPILSLVWGMPAVIGVVFAGICLMLLQSTPVIITAILRETVSLFILAYLPYRLWYSMFIVERKPLFILNLRTLMKFVFILFVSNFFSAAIFGITASQTMLYEISDLLGGQTVTHSYYTFLRFINDFDVALFVATPIFLLLIGIGFEFRLPFDRASDTTSPALSVLESLKYRELVVLICALTSLFAVIYITMIYSGIIQSLASFATWHIFVMRIFTLMDFVFIAFLALLLKFKNSIMLELIMLTVVTVFATSTIFGNLGIFTIEDILDRRSEEDLRQIGVIEVEHLSGIFDNVELSAKNMQNFVESSIEDFDRVLNDEEYRAVYIDETERFCKINAENTKGITSFYMRLNPEIISSQKNDGFFELTIKARESKDINHFTKVTPTDISQYEKSDMEHVGWYYLPVQAGKPIWTPPYLNENANIYMISYVIPMYEQGQFFGVVGMDIDMNYIIDEVRKMSVYRDGYAYLIDEDDKVIYHKDYSVGQIVPENSSVRTIDLHIKEGMRLVIAGSIEEMEEDRNDLVIRLIMMTLIVSVFLSLLGIRIASGIVKPLLQVDEAAKKIAKGHLEVDLNYREHNELGSMVQSIHEMAQKLDEYMYRDKMTGVKNNAAYIRAVTELDEKVKNGETVTFGVIVFDVNSLKYVNDNFGHDAGNDLIKRATGMISDVFSDSPIYRTGGDEFTAIITGEDYMDREYLLSVFDKYVHYATMKLGDTYFHVSVSHGLGIFNPDTDKSYQDVFNRADAAMYVYKQQIKKELHLPGR